MSSNRFNEFRKKLILSVLARTQDYQLLLEKSCLTYTNQDHLSPAKTLLIALLQSPREHNLTKLVLVRLRSHQFPLSACMHQNVWLEKINNQSTLSNKQLHGQWTVLSNLHRHSTLHHKLKNKAQ